MAAAVSAMPMATRTGNSQRRRRCIGCGIGSSREDRGAESTDEDIGVRAERTYISLRELWGPLLGRGNSSSRGGGTSMFVHGANASSNSAGV